MCVIVPLQLMWWGEITNAHNLIFFSKKKKTQLSPIISLFRMTDFLKANELVLWEWKMTHPHIMEITNMITIKINLGSLIHPFFYPPVHRSGTTQTFTCDVHFFLNITHEFFVWFSTDHASVLLWNFTCRWSGGSLLFGQSKVQICVIKSRF